MAGIYSRAIGRSRQIEEEKGRALSESGMKELATDEKVYDVEKEFQDKSENALENAGWLKTAGSIIGGGIAMATGVGPIMAAMYAAGGTAAGAVAGKHQLNQAYKGGSMGKWKQGAQSKVQKGYIKDSAMSIMQSAIMAGTAASGGAETMEGAAKASDLGTKANMAELSNIEGIGAGKFGEKSVMETSGIDFENVEKSMGFEYLPEASQKELISSVEGMKVDAGIVDPSYAKNPMGKGFDWSQAKRNIQTGLFGAQSIKGATLKSILENEDEETE